MTSVSFIKPTGNASAPLMEGANSSAPSPTYTTIITSNDPLLTKIRALYVVSVQNVKSLFSTTRPWAEFFNRAHFALPTGVSDVSSRLSQNIPYFYNNYIFLSIFCCSYILMINPLFSLSMLFLLLCFFQVRALALRADSTGEIYLWDRGFTPVQLDVILSIAALLAFYLTGGMDIVFWILLISVGVSGLHAALRQPVFDEPTFQLP